MMFKYGYIFYRVPIDSKGDIHEIIDLTDKCKFFSRKNRCNWGDWWGELPEDWAGAYKIANENKSWRNGHKVIIHLTDSGAHGKLFTKSDKYPEEEPKLIQELEKCALKNIKIFGYAISFDCRNTFDECSKIYRSKGGSFEIFDYICPEIQNMSMNPMMGMSFGGIMGMNPMMNADKSKMDMSMGMNHMNMMNSNPMMMGMNSMNMMNAPNQMLGMSMGKKILWWWILVLWWIWAIKKSLIRILGWMQ